MIMAGKLYGQVTSQLFNDKFALMFPLTKHYQRTLMHIHKHKMPIIAPCFVDPRNFMSGRPMSNMLPTLPRGLKLPTIACASCISTALRNKSLPPPPAPFSGRAAAAAPKSGPPRGAASRAGQRHPPAATPRPTFRPGPSHPMIRCRPLPSTLPAASAPIHKVGQAHHAVIHVICHVMTGSFPMILFIRITYRTGFL
jgi:hypothetical protein